MFPRIECVIKGLKPEGVYSIILSMKHLEPCKFNFTENRWVHNEQVTARPKMWTNAVLHPDQSASGEQWMRAPVNFDGIKLTKKAPPDNTTREVGTAQWRVEWWTLGEGWV